jgi:hypothetical protein
MLRTEMIYYGFGFFPITALVRRYPSENRMTKLNEAIWNFAIGLRDHPRNL